MRCWTYGLIPTRTGGVRRGGRRGALSRLAGLRAGILVHQCDSAPARPGSGRRDRVVSRARRLVTLNLAVERETAGLSLPDHLRALARYLPGLRVDVVLADGKAVGDPMGLQVAAESLGARVVLAPVAVADGSPRHDPAALADALYEVFDSEPSPHRAG